MSGSDPVQDWRDHQRVMQGGVVMNSPMSVNGEGAQGAGEASDGQEDGPWKGTGQAHRLQGSGDGDQGAQTL